MSTPATVLVADDDPDIRTLVELTVRRAGLVVVASVDDGSAALAAAVEHRPDVAVLDVSMPGLTGLQVCQALRADPGAAGLRVLVLSADAQETAVRAGLDAGADDYLAKPFTLRELRERLTTLVGGAA